MWSILAIQILPLQPSLIFLTAPLTITVDGLGSIDPDGSVVSYTWDFGDGNTATGSSASNTYISIGTYTMVLIVTDNQGVTTQDNISVLVSAPNLAPTASANASATSGNAPLLVSFDASASADNDGSISSYSWNYGDGNSGTGINPSHTYTTAGNYTAVLTVTDNDGATDQWQTAITANAAPTGVTLEYGSVSGVSNSWITVTLNNTYTSMVVVATPVLPNSSATSVVTRIRNASGSSFDLRIQGAGTTASGNYNVEYLVVEEGDYSVANGGINMEAVKVTSTVTARKSGWTYESRSYNNTYSNPVVLGQVMTYNDADWSVFWASQNGSRTNPPTASSFACGKHVAEDPDQTRANETIGYIVVESGSGQLNGFYYEASVGSDIVKGTDNTSSGYNYNTGVTAQNAVLSTAAVDGNNGTWPVFYGVSPISTSLTLVAEECEAADSERKHITEQAAYFAFGNAVSKRQTEQTDVKNILVSQSILLYPNPAAERIHLEFNASEDGQGEYTIYDLRGAVVAHSKIQTIEGENELEIDIHELPAGSYILQFTRNHNTDRKQFIVQ
jgi:PKD repeat protein